MDFNFRGWDAQMEHMYNAPVKDGLSSGTSLGGGHGGLGILPGSVDMREAIQRELEKERIRKEILAEEIARKRVLEAEVRREIAMETAMHGGGGFPSSFMPRPPLSHNNRLEPGMPRGQPFGGFQVASVQRLPSLPADGKKKVIDLGKPNGGTLSGAKGKPAAAGSSQWCCAACKVSATCEHGFNEHLAGKKHQAQMAALRAKNTERHHGTHLQKTCKKESNSPSISRDGMIKLKNNKSAEIGLGVASSKKSTTMESKVLKSKTQPPLMTKNSNKCVSINSKKEDAEKSEGEKFLFWCEMCHVGASSDKVMNAHIKGKKHLKNLLNLHQVSGRSPWNQKGSRLHGETEVGDKDKLRKHGKNRS